MRDLERRADEDASAFMEAAEAQRAEVKPRTLSPDPVKSRYFSLNAVPQRQMFGGNSRASTPCTGFLRRWLGRAGGPKRPKGRLRRR